MGQKKARSGEPEGLPDLTRGTLDQSRKVVKPEKFARSGNFARSVTGGGRTHVPPAAAVRTLPRVDRFFGPGGRLAEVLAGYEPRAEQAALAARRRGRAGRRRAPARRGRDRNRQEPCLPDPGARVRAARGRLDRDEGAPGAAADEGRAVAAAALGRDVRVAVLKGRQNYLCRHGAPRLRAARRPALPRAEDAAAFEAMRDWIDTTETGDRAELELEPPETRLDRDRRRRRPLPRPPLRLRRRLLLRGCPRPRLARRARDREPRALLRRPRPARPHRRAGGPPRARRRRLRRGAPARGVGRDLARRPDQRAGPAPAAPRRRPRLPRGRRPVPGARARPGRARGAAAAPRGRAARRAGGVCARFPRAGDSRSRRARRARRRR